jgi:hypothetical protein
MQVIQAGGKDLLLLELEPEVIGTLVSQVGFESELEDASRTLTLELHARDRQAPLLLFDAADPMNVGWFKRCQFYVDGTTGKVLQTPMMLGNVMLDDRPSPHSVRVQIAKEIPASFRFPGKQPVNERLVYGVVNDLLHALLHVGVGLCGNRVVQPLTGRRP